MPRQNLHDLLAFIAVARERGFTRAAAQFGVSQSALSHTLSGLDPDHGQRGADRGGRAPAAHGGATAPLGTDEPAEDQSGSFRRSRIATATVPSTISCSAAGMFRQFQPPRAATLYPAGERIAATSCRAMPSRTSPTDRSTPSCRSSGCARPPATRRDRAPTARRQPSAFASRERAGPRQRSRSPPTPPMPSR